MYAHMPIIRDILYGAASRGANLTNLCKALNISIEELNDSDKSVDFETAYQSWELAVKDTHDSLIGLHLGETATPSILGLIGHLMQSSPDLLSAYQQVCKHAVLATDMFRYSIESSKEQIILRYEPARLWLKVSNTSARQAVEQAMAGTLNVFYLLSGKHIKPVQTEFSFSKHKSVAEYDRIFSSSLKFSSRRNVLIFNTTDLKAKVISYDKSLFALFDRIIGEKVERLMRKTSLSDQVRRILTQEFKGQIVSAGVLTAHMGMSVRTFQRKLHEEGTSYRELSTNLRKELAFLLLKKDSSMQDVARMLGYSEASALRKALKIN